MAEDLDMIDMLQVSLRVPPKLDTASSRAYADRDSSRP